VQKPQWVEAEPHVLVESVAPSLSKGEECEVPGGDGQYSALIFGVSREIFGNVSVKVEFDISGRGSWWQRGQKQ